MEECGFGDYIKDMKKFRIFTAIVPLYMMDPEVMNFRDAIASAINRKWYKTLLRQRSES